FKQVGVQPQRSAKRWESNVEFGIRQLRANNLAGGQQVWKHGHSARHTGVPLGLRTRIQAYRPGREIVQARQYSTDIGEVIERAEASAHAPETFDHDGSSIQLLGLSQSG